jgi:hypothetical protein
MAPVSRTPVDETPAGRPHWTGAALAASVNRSDEESPRFALIGDGQAPPPAHDGMTRHQRRVC